MKPFKIYLAALTLLLFSDSAFCQFSITNAGVNVGGTISPWTSCQQLRTTALPTNWSTVGTPSVTYTPSVPSENTRNYPGSTTNNCSAYAGIWFDESALAQPWDNSNNVVTLSPNDNVIYFRTTFNTPSGGVSSIPSTISFQLTADDVADLWLNGTYIGSVWRTDCNSDNIYVKGPSGYTFTGYTGLQSTCISGTSSTEHALSFNTSSLTNTFMAALNTTPGGPNVLAIVAQNEWVYCRSINIYTGTVGSSLQALIASASGSNCGTAITASGSGGTGPYTYLWSPGGATTASITPTSSGTYTVTVTDAATPTHATATASVYFQAPVSLSSSIILQPICGSNNGQAIAIPTGGAAPFAYSWSDGDATQTTSNLGTGSYTVTVTDGNSCTATATGTATCGSCSTLNCVTAGCTSGTNTTNAVPGAGVRVGASYSGTFGSTTGVWSALGTGDIGNSPNNNNLYGLSVQNSSTKALFGTRSDLNTVMDWGGNNSGTLSNLKFDFHTPGTTCNASVSNEIATLNPKTVVPGTNGANGWMGINTINSSSGASAPTAVLHVVATGQQATNGIRFEGLPTETYTNAVVADANGNLGLGTLPTISCATTNMLPKITGANDLGCSRIYDNGTDVGIGNTAPNAALHIGGSSISDMIVGYGSSTKTYYLTNGGSSLSDSRLVIDMESQGGYAGLLIKGGYANNTGGAEADYPTMGFSSNNKSAKDILGATIVGAITGVTAGSESMDLYFATQTGGTAASEKVRITGGGSLCVGTTTARTYSGTGTALGTAPTNGTLSKLDVNGLAFANYMVVSSDLRFKKNIQKIDSALQTVLKLNGVTYDWNKEANKTRNFDDIKQAGFIAQEVKSIYPVAVVQDEEGYYAMNYNAMLPLITEAIKELSGKTDSISILKEALNNTNIALNNTNITMGNQIAALQNQINDLCNGGCANLKNSVDAPQNANLLLQNVPNPFSKQSTIGYVINVGTRAFININSLDGKTIKHIEVSVNGSNYITIDSNEMSPGTYTYSLFVDNRVVDTKIMVITSQD